MHTLARNWGWVLSGMVLLGLLVYSFRPLPVEVDIAPVIRGPLLVTVTAEGKTRIKERYVVSAPLNGQLLRIRYRPGDQVTTAETVLAIIEPSDPGLLDARAKAEIEGRVKATEASRQRADAALKRAKSSHALAVTQWERMKRLRGSGSASAEEMDAAESQERVAADEVRVAEFAVRVAEFEHEVAKAARIRIQPRQSAETEQERFEVRSPVGGRVLRVFQESEAVVTGGTRLLEVGDPRDLEMEIDVLSTDAVKVKPGSRVIVDHWGGPNLLTGRVRVVEPAGFLKVSALGVEEQRVYVIADFLDPYEKRKPLGDAYRVEARIVTSEGEAVKIPAGAVFRKAGGWACFVVRENKAVLVEVSVGRTNGFETELLSGLQEGDMVVVHPSDQVKDGVRLISRR